MEDKLSASNTELGLIERHRLHISQQSEIRTKSDGSDKDWFFENRVALSVSEAAFALGVSVRTVERMIRRNELRIRRLGKRILIPKEELGAWLSRKE